MGGRDLEQALKRHRFIVAFDRQADELCIVDTAKALEEGRKTGDPIPESAQIRCALSSAEIFIQAVLNAIAADADVSTILSGALKIADAETIAWADLGTHLRAEFDKRGASAGENRERVQVEAGELARLRKLENLVAGIVKTDREDGVNGATSLVRMMERLVEAVDGKSGGA